jgi:hypothetical protein
MLPIALTIEKPRPLGDIQEGIAVPSDRLQEYAGARRSQTALGP